MQVRADYTYRINNEEVLAIEDLNLGNMSVTNDIEAVLEEIKTKEKMSPEQFDSIIIVYKDSDGRWDGWNQKTNTFVSGGEDGYYHGAVANARIALYSKKVERDIEEEW